MAIAQFSGVSISAKANVHFDGRVLSHGITFRSYLVIDYVADLPLPKIYQLLDWAG